LAGSIAPLAQALLDGLEEHLWPMLEHLQEYLVKEAENEKEVSHEPRN